METPISKTRLIVIGGSAGSLQVIMEMIKNLDNNLGFSYRFGGSQKSSVYQYSSHFVAAVYYHAGFGS